MTETIKVSFPKLGITMPVNETAFTVFGLEIKWYGLIITGGLLLAMVYGFSQMKKYGVDPERAVDAVIAGIIGAIVGARVYYVLMDIDSYSSLKEMINIRNGGLAVYGGIIGAILVGGITAKIKGLRLIPLLDVLGIGLLLGQGIGRWGNFTNQEAFGYNTDNIFGMTSPAIRDTIISGGLDMDPNMPVHPCFLYESAWCLLGFLLFALFAKKIRRFDGQIFLLYLIWYGSERFFVESLRTDSLMLGTIRVSQALSAVLVVGAVILLIVFTGRVKRMGTDYVLYVDTDESKNMIRESEEKAKKIPAEDKKNIPETASEESEGSGEEKTDIL